MKYIVAPWRKEYILQAFDMEKCIFCSALNLNNDRKALILHRAEYNFIILNRYPYNPGHLMIAPYRHLDSIEKSKKEEAFEMTELLQLCLKILRKKYNPQGFNTGMNLGRSAGAGVTSHYHLHIIPRWTGDSNIMPIIGKTKVVLEDLKSTYDQLVPLFKEAI
ncbi:MAG: HIT domain-containing protein [Candidatus Aminicenantes bacterium]|nr:HIT domain-containing protein [Candidatus Aminicenantes bacterium]